MARKRPDGRYQVTLEIGTGGIRRRKFFYGTTLKEAQNKKALAESELIRHKVLPNDNVTISQYLPAWLSSIKSSLRPKTHKFYIYIGKHLLIPYLGNKRLTELTPVAVSRMLNAIVRDGLSITTANHARTVLCVMLNHAVADRLLYDNAASHCRRLYQPKREITPWSAEEAKRFLEYVKGSTDGLRWHALYAVGLAVGMRQAEILGLRWRDVDLDTGLVIIKWSFQSVDGQPTFMPTKQGTTHSIKLPATLLTILRDHKERQESLKQTRFEQGRRWVENDLVFCTRYGTAIGARNLTRHYYDVREAARVPLIRLHDHRHTCATLLLAQGCTLNEVKQVLGHSQIGITANIYGHWAEQIADDAAAAAERGLFGA